MSKMSLPIKVILCIFYSSFVSGTRLRFYTGNGFTGLHHESKSANSCTNFPRNSRPEIRSFSTDTCAILYGYQNCKGYWTKKFLPSKHEFPTNWAIGSFQLCNEKEGGPQLNVDIINYFEVGVKEIPATIKSYKNVCDCVNVPLNVQQMDKWSINNHGNELLSYFEPNCAKDKWGARYIPGGHDDSRDMYKYSRTDRATELTYKIQSFGPDPNSSYFKASCVSQNVTSLLTNVPLKEYQELEQKYNEFIHYIQNIQMQVNLSLNTVEKRFKAIEIMLNDNQHEFEDKLEKHMLEFRELKENVDNLPVA